MAARPTVGREARQRRIPEATIVRLPLYQRILAEMLHEGSTTVSSEALAERARVTAAKVRKDFSLFGSFGTRGTGYDTAFLATQIDRALGADRDWPIAIIGIGNLGRALANSDGFASHGFRVAGLYDVDPAVVGARVAGLRVAHLAELPEGPRAAIGVIAAPAAGAQAVADALVAAGVGSILNFAPRVLSVRPGVMVRYVDLSIELQVMSFFLTRRDPRLPPLGVEPGLRPGAGHGGGADSGLRGGASARGRARSQAG
ncbi:MAG: redox-sensing transcriptional repressor Rex [Acidimicrobiales bacterium]